MIFIPVDKSKEYYRWTLLTSFVVLMLWLVSVFYGDYQKAEHNSKQLTRMIDDVKKRSPPPPVPHEYKSKTLKKNGKEVTVDLPVKLAVPDSTIEIDALIVKVKMSNESSWNAIIKMIVTVLSMFFGIKLINFGFARITK